MDIAAALPLPHENPRISSEKFPAQIFLQQG